ncbi:32892_t:CDS:1, partial [Racocetra persica]
LDSKTTINKTLLKLDELGQKQLINLYSYAWVKIHEKVTVLKIESKPTRQ